LTSSSSILNPQSSIPLRDEASHRYHDDASHF
jgi:hypothetical protein